MSEHRSHDSPLTAFASFFGEVTLLGWNVLKSVLRFRIRFAELLKQIAFIGVGSQAVVIITGGFTGAVFAAQAYYKFNQLGLATATGPVVSLAMCRELGPVLAGLMVAGRAGASMAAEIGSMKVTEQIDALRAMGVAPTDYLVVPRTLAMVISMPILVGEAIAFGILAADLITVELFAVPRTWFWEQLSQHTGPDDILVGLIKGAFFGLIIVLTACQQGLGSSGGASGVGKATTQTVVYASLTILIVNLFLTLGFNQWLPMIPFAP
ncbi:MAG: ABC transporter permease [Verrucomicrobiales bacterium]|nr:ABC transporter permease [Verrucomicrobiales bacterium]